MKHAFLIIAHNKWNQLIDLLKQIDSCNHDIFIHIDKKCKNIPIEEINNCVKLSNIEIYSEYKVYWGSFQIVQTEIFLMKKAFEKEYDYYHLLSGMDLIIKSQRYIDDFFEKNKGYEFVHFDTNERLKTDKEIERRTKYFHIFTNYRRRYSIKIFNLFFDFLARFSLIVQMFLGIDRRKKFPNDVIKYGSQWFSITNDLVTFILENEKKIYSIFKKSKCADELFVQTLVYNSRFKDSLYNKKFDDDVNANMRLIDIKKRGKNGNPYVWTINDKEEIKKSECLFARKFDYEKDKEIIKYIIDNNR